jgi:transposase
MVVVDHDTGRLVWACRRPRQERTLGVLFDALGEARCAKVRLVSADAAEWMGEVVAPRCPNASMCLDGFHIVAWATDALEVVRQQTWNDARRGGATGHASELKGARYARWKNPEDLTDRHAVKLASIAKVNTRRRGGGKDGDRRLTDPAQVA